SAGSDVDMSGTDEFPAHRLGRGPTAQPGQMLCQNGGECCRHMLRNQNGGRVDHASHCAENCVYGLWPSGGGADQQNARTCRRKGPQQEFFALVGAACDPDRVGAALAAEIRQPCWNKNTELCSGALPGT